MDSTQPAEAPLRQTWGGPPRRRDRTLTAEAGYLLLDRAPYGVLAMSSPDGQPYAVPMSFGRDGQKLYFHSAPEGRKLELIRTNPRAVLCVAECGPAIPADTACATTLPYRSALVFGLLREVSSPAEKAAGLAAVCRAHGIEPPGSGDPGWQAYWARAERTVVLALDIEQVTVKGRA